MTIMRPARLAFLVGAIVVSPATLVVAQSAQSDPLVREGIELRRAGRNDEALDRFRRAWSRTHSPISLGQMGLAEQAVGQWLSAEQHIREVLSLTGEDWVVRNRASLEQAYSVIQQHIGLIEVVGQPDGAVVLINGRPAGTLPLNSPIRSEAGHVTVDVRAEGFYIQSRRVDVEAGHLMHLEFRLLRAQLATPGPAPGVVQQNAASQTAGTSATGGRYVVARILLTVAGLGATGAAVWGLWWSAANTAQITPNCGSHPLCARWRSDRTTGDQVAVAGFIMAGGFFTTSLVLALVRDPSSAPRSARHVECGGGPGDIGITCGAAF